MHISNKIAVYQAQYATKKDNLGLVHHHPYLSVESSDDLKWNIHTSHLSAISNRALGFY